MATNTILKNYKEILDSFFGNCPLPIFSFTEEFEIMGSNKAFKVLENNTPFTTCEKLFDSMSLDFYCKFKSAFQEIISQENKNNVQFDKWTDDKQHYTVIINSGPVISNQRLYLAIINDITVSKKEEQMLKAAKELAEQAAKTKSDFIANVSHEIRTPLHTIIGMSELMLDTPLNEEQKEYGDQILYSAGVLLSLVNNILDFSKIEAGKLDLEKIPFNLYETFEDAVFLISMEAHKKGLEIIMGIGSDVPEIIVGDPIRFRQIIMNLLNNAIKFTKKGEIDIKATVLSSENGKLFLGFSVKDTGIGVPDLKQEFLFKAFTQIDSSVTRKFGGTGLGLSICKKLTELFDGHIGFKSKNGVGSTFFFDIATTIPRKTNLKSKLPPEKIKFPDKVVILVVDDNKTSRRQITSYLKELGAVVYEGTNGNAVLDFFKKGYAKKINLILVDQHMPGMDGWQLASELNANEKYAEIKKILMTPIGMAGDEAKMKLLNWFDSYIKKPVKKWQLYNAVFKALDIVIDIHEESGLDAEKELANIKEMLTFNRKKFLLAEDYLINQKLFKKILNNLNIDVVTADNGEEAVELVKKEKFDLILMDLQMPIMNGFDASIKIRELGIKTPIIAVTANAVEGEKENCIAVGMNDFLAKPFKRIDLVELFSKWIITDGESVSEEVAELEEIEAAPASNLTRNGLASKASSFLATYSTDKKDEETSANNMLNFEEALEIFGDKEMLCETLDEFIKKVEEQLAEMKKLLEKNDFETLQREAHSIKGGAWTLSIKKFGDAANMLESSAKNNLAFESDLYLKELSAIFPSLKKEIILQININQ